MGRRTKATDGRVEGILNALRAGSTRRAAAAFGEIDRATFYRWLDSDASFRDSVEKAEGAAEFRFTAQVAKAATTGTWQAAAWWLERRHPEDYALKQRMEMTGKDGGPMEHKDVTDGLSDHEKQALSRAIRDELARRADFLPPEAAVGDPVPA